MDDLGSLENTQEARVALGYRLEQLLRLPRASITRYTHAKLEPILKDVRAQKFPRTDFVKTLTTGRK